MSTSMPTAFATAKPLVTSHIRLVTFNGKKTLSVYFKDHNLHGRYFRLGEIVDGLISVDEADIVRQRGDRSVRDYGGTSMAVVLDLPKLNMFQPFKMFNADISPSWTNGKLSYLIQVPAEARIDTSDIPEATEAMFKKAKLVKPDQVMPRPTTLRQVLSDLRKIERDSPYRLERDSDGVLQFVARIS